MNTKAFAVTILSSLLWVNCCSIDQSLDGIETNAGSQAKNERMRSANMNQQCVNYKIDDPNLLDSQVMLYHLILLCVYLPIISLLLIDTTKWTLDSWGR